MLAPKSSLCFFVSAYKVPFSGTWKRTLLLLHFYASKPIFGKGGVGRIGALKILPLPKLAWPRPPPYLGTQVDLTTKAREFDSQHFRQMPTRGGGEVWKPLKLADMICGQPLTDICLQYWLCCTLKTATQDPADWILWNHQPTKLESWVFKSWASEHFNLAK